MSNLMNDFYHCKRELGHQFRCLMAASMELAADLKYQAPL